MTFASAHLNSVISDGSVCRAAQKESSSGDSVVLPTLFLTFKVETKATFLCSLFLHFYVAFVSTLNVTNCNTNNMFV